MTATLDVPAPAEVRRATRRYRRAHVEGQLSERASDIYMLVLAAGMVVATLLTSAHRHRAGTAPVRATPLAATTLTVAVVLLLAGGGLLVLAAVGPLFAGAATQTWQLSTPGDRGRWLAPRLAWLLAAAAGVGAVTGGAVAVAALIARAGPLMVAPVLWAVGGGAVLAVTVTAAAAAAQPGPDTGSGRRSGGRMPAVRPSGRALIGLGALGVALALALDRLHRSGPAHGPALLVTALVVAATAVAGVVATVLAGRALPRLDRAALGSGAQLAGSALVAAVGMDPTMLLATVEADRLRRIGRGSARPLRAASRHGALLAAELRRLGRNPGALLRWAGLALVPYAAALVASPALVTAVRLVAGYVAVNGLASGLRAVSRSAALRRSLGGSDFDLRVSHLVVPAVGALVWVAATAGAGKQLSPVVTVVAAAGLAAATYRTATRQPIGYDAAWSTSPMGPVPVGLVAQVLRGPDLAVVLALILAYAL